ncbi:MAG TPA: hypothetical protein IAB17_06740 [Candidatus Alectryocaccobium stercorigallinarum]|nr:hypothetical protein [Candidatus Alectryocaccobium stercorigallinarum]
MILDMLKTNVLAAAVILLTVLLARVLKNRYSVKWKYITWIAVAVFLLIPAQVYSVAPIIEVNIPQNIYTETNSEILSETIAESSTDPEGTGKTDTVAGGIQPDSISSSNQLNETDERFSKNTAGTVRVVVSLETVLNVFAFVWIDGIGIALVVFFVRHSLAMKRLKIFRTDKLPSFYKEIYRQTGEKMNIKKCPALYINEDINSPLLAGVFKPRLYLPETEYSPSELELIFLHELNHYKYKDIVFKIFLQTVRTIYWFNPALILMTREAERDIESICDSRVMGYVEKKEGRTAYGKLLLKTAVEINPYGAAAAGLNDGVAKFKERVGYMMRSEKLKRGLPAAALMAAVLFVSGSLIGCSLGPGTASLSESSQSGEETLSSSSSAADSPGTAETSIASSIDEEFLASSSSVADSSETSETSASSSVDEELVASSSSIADSSYEETSETSGSSSVDVEPEDDDTSEFQYTAVPAQYRLYEVTYVDSRGHTGLTLEDGLPEDVYQIEISNVTSTSFDFSIIHWNWVEDKILDTPIENATAVFVGDGTEARYLDDEFDLVFMFPDIHSALPDVADIEVHGYKPMEGETYSYNGIPGHEFS